MSKPPAPPPCPRCGSRAVVRAENEEDHRSRETIPLVFAAAFLILGSYFAFLVYAYLAYPLTVLLFTAAAAAIIRYRERTRKPVAPEAVRYYCNDCNDYFVFSPPGSGDGGDSRAADPPSTFS